MSALITLAAASALHLVSGHAQVLAAGGALTRVAIADPKVLDVRVLGSDRLMVQPLAPGQTGLYLWTKTGGMKGYDVTVTLDATGAQQAVREATGNAGFTVKAAGRSLLLRGEARSGAEHDLGLKVAGAYGEVVDATRMVTAREQVAIEVEVLELAKSAALNFGLTFGGGQVTGITNGIRQYVFAPGQLMAGEATTGNPASFGTIDFLATRIDALQTRGEAKLLARPTLVTSSGGTASFLAGGEIPIPVPQGLGQTTITWKEFGVRLEVTPTVAADGKIDLAVKPEVSSLDFSNGVKQDNITIPAIRTRRADTRVNLGAGQTLMLGGLLDSGSDHTLTLLPGVGDLPVIGELLRSRAFQDHRTELAILVTPRLIGPSSTPPGALGRTRAELEDKQP